jgi:hypothetical protein
LPSTPVHWRRVVGADGGAVWADLSAAGSFTFGDADYLPFAGWTVIDDDSTPAGQRYDSAHLKGLMADPAATGTERLEAERSWRKGRARHFGMRRGSAATSCSFPTPATTFTVGAIAAEPCQRP